jgi:hypothetical protein
MRTFRSHQRQARRGRGATAVQSVKAPGMSKLSKDKMLIALTQQLLQKQAKSGERPADPEKIHFDF